MRAAIGPSVIAYAERWEGPDKRASRRYPAGSKERGRRARELRQGPRSSSAEHGNCLVGLDHAAERRALGVDIPRCAKS
jgi:hypothetical protein